MIIYVSHNKDTDSISVTTDTGELDVVLNTNTIVNTEQVLEFELAVDISPLQEMEDILPEEEIIEE